MYIAPTYSINQTQSVELDPGRHEIVSKSNQTRFVAKHKLLGSHLNKGLCVSLPNQHIQAQSSEVGRIAHHVRDTLQQTLNPKLII